MSVVSTPLPGVFVFEPRAFTDDRGFFIEIFRASRYAEAGVPQPFVQDNFSSSSRGTLRGLHFQEPHAQGKLVTVLEGAVLDVAVDIRRGSPTFAKWFQIELTGDNHKQLWVPPGFAHGFCVTSEHALVLYKCTHEYVPEADRGIRWNDPTLSIPWPEKAPRLSPKDAQAPLLDQADVLPSWSGS
jgi:dTDP-4-dehydrorhamnose 3,5-epimerase